MVCEECSKKKENSIVVHEAALYALQYIISVPLQKLYRFTLKPDAFWEMEQVIKWGVAHFIDKNFRSLKVLETLQNGKNPVK